jgi:DNA-binding MarR family transcriptional regulator
VDKRVKILLLLSISLLLLSIPNAGAEESDEKGKDNVLECQTTEDIPSRPTLLPDLTLSSKDISFSMEKLEEEEFIIIEATIHNNGVIGAFGYIEFFDGGIDRDNLIGAGSIFVKRWSANTISICWPATPGKHNIYVLIEDSTPREVVVWNNVAGKEIIVTNLDDAYDSGDGGNTKDDNSDGPLNIISLPSDNPVVTAGATGSFALLLIALTNKQYSWLWSLGLLPLYSRITNGQVLDQNTRKDIYEYIVSNPGANFSLIMKALKLKNGVTSYHLAMLEREGYITSKHTGLYRRYYVNGANTKDLPQSKIRREIIKTIVDNPGLSQTDIASIIGVSNQVVNYHIGILRKSNIIKTVKEGYRTKCFINSV